MSTSKIVIYIISGIIGLVVIFFLARFFINRQYTSRLPDIPINNSISATVLEQIELADKNARRNPSPENLGMLGMVYHSSAYYDQAGICYGLAIDRNKSDWKWNYYQGYLNIELGNSDAAIENFNQVIKKNPDIQLAWFYAGSEYKNVGNTELAEKSFDEISNFIKNAEVSSKYRRDHFPLATYSRFELARIYFDSGQLDKAEETLKEIIQKYYLFGPAYRLLGNVYNTKGNEELGKKFTVRANDLVLYSPPVDTLIDKLVLLSRSDLYLLKRIDEAERSVYPEWTLELINHGLQYLPDNKYLISKAIRTYLWQMQNNKATVLVDKHISMFEDNFPELNRTAMLFFRKGLYSEAIRYWEQALTIEPDNIENQQNLAKCHAASGDKEKSNEILEEIYHRNTSNPEIQAETIYTMYFFGEKEKAVDYLQQVRKKAPSNPDILKLSAEIAREKGNINDAISNYEAALKTVPEDVQSIRKLGDLLFKQKQWKKYETHYRNSLEIYPNDPELLERLGTFYINCPDTLYKNIYAGKEYVERAFTYYDCPPDILLSAGTHLAYAHAFLGDKQKAITIISQTINIAKGQNVSDSYMKMLENFYRTFTNMQ